MRRFCTWAFLASNVFFHLSQGWILDASCKTVPRNPKDLSQGTVDLEATIVKAVDAAISMADKASTLMARRPWNPANSADQDIINLAKWIFKDEGSTVCQSKPHPPLVDNRRNLDKAQDILWGVQRLGPRVDSGGQKQASETHDDKLFNKVLKIFKKLKPGSKDPCTESKGSLLAFAQVVGVAQGGIDNLPSEVQLCPDYLSELVDVAFVSTVTIKDLVKPLENWLSSRTLMDTYDTLDCTILHEFFHHIFGGLLDDMKPAYGWENVVAKPGDKAIQNAESMMFFALGLRMITQQGLIPQEDGTVVRAGGTIG